MIYYLFIYFYLYMCALGNITKNFKFVILFSFFFFTFISVTFGLRYDVGIDYLQYEYNFINQDIDSVRDEFVYSYINIFFKYFFDEFFYLTLFYSFIINFIFFFFVKKNLKNVNLFLLGLGFYIIGFLSFSLNGMRQALALSILILAIYLIKNYFLKIFLIIISFFTHMSILFLLLFYFFLVKNEKIMLTRKMVLILVLLLFISFPLAYSGIINKALQLFLDQIPLYINYRESSVLEFRDINNPLGVFLKSGLGFLISVIYYLNWSKVESKYRIFFVFYMLGLILNVLSLATFMIGRVGVLYSVFEIISIPYSLILIRDKLNRSFLYFIFLIVIVIFFYKIYLDIDYLNPLYYRSVFDV